MLHNPHLDGTPFYWPASGKRSAPVGVLLVHGFTATVAEVRPLAEYLRAEGYAVLAPLLPGHGTTPEELNRVHWRDWVACMQESYARLRADYPTVVAGGESTGGLLAMHLALEHPEIAALLLYAPALRLSMTRMDELRLRLAAPFVPHLPKAHSDDETPWQGYPVNPLKGVQQLLGLQKQVAPHLARIRQPTLIVQGRLDQTVHPTVPDRIAAGISSEIIEQHWLPASAHCVLLDKEQAQVNQITLAFLDKIVGH